MRLLHRIVVCGVMLFGGVFGLDGVEGISNSRGLLGFFHLVQQLLFVISADGVLDSLTDGSLLLFQRKGFFEVAFPVFAVVLDAFIVAVKHFAEVRDNLREEFPHDALDELGAGDFFTRAPVAFVLLRDIDAEHPPIAVGEMPERLHESREEHPASRILADGDARLAVFRSEDSHHFDLGDAVRQRSDGIFIAHSIVAFGKNCGLIYFNAVCWLEEINNSVWLTTVRQV